MSTFKLDNFRSEVLAFGLAKSHRFEVIITAPPGLDSNSARLGSLFADGTQLPTTRLNTTTQRMWGSPRIIPLWAEYGGDNITVNFHIDRLYKVKTFFDNWIDKVVSRQTSTVAYRDEYVTDIKIHQLDEQDKETYGVVLKEAFPISVNPIQLDMASVGLSRLSVTFAYKKWFPLVATPPAPKPPSIVKPNPVVATDPRKIDYLNNPSPLGGDSVNLMSFETNSGFGA